MPTFVLAKPWHGAQQVFLDVWRACHSHLNVEYKSGQQSFSSQACLLNEVILSQSTVAIEPLAARQVPGTAAAQARRAAAAAPEAVRAACPGGWASSGSICVVMTASTFTSQVAAEKSCRSLHGSGQGTLAKLRSTTEMEQAAAAASLSSSVTYWVGLRWSELKQSPRHSDGTQQAIAALPRNDFTQLSASPCVVMSRKLVLLFRQDWTLYDSSCTLTTGIPAMCSIPAVVAASDIYNALPGRHTWRQAQQKCAALSMSIATPRSTTEANYLLSFAAADEALWTGMSTNVSGTLDINSWQVDSGVSPALTFPAAPVGQTALHSPHCPGACAVLARASGTMLVEQSNCCMLKKVVCERLSSQIQAGACLPGWLHERAERRCIRLIPGQVKLQAAFATCNAIGARLWQPHTGFGFFASWMLTDGSQGKIWTSLRQGTGTSWDSINNDISFTGISGSTDTLAVMSIVASSYSFAGSAPNAVASPVCETSDELRDSDIICPPGWVRVETVCYKAYHKLVGAFSAAQFACSSLGASSLAIVKSELHAAAIGGAVLAAEAHRSPAHIATLTTNGWVGVHPGTTAPFAPKWADGTALCSGAYPDTFVSNCSTAALNSTRISLSISSGESLLIRSNSSEALHPVCEFDSAAVVCPSGFSYFKGLCVGLAASQTGAWSNAEATCHTLGGSLLNIDSPELHAWLVSKSLLNHGANSWVGLTSAVFQGTPEWFGANGQPATFIPWSGNVAVAPADGLCAYHAATTDAALQSRVTSRNCNLALTNRPLCAIESFATGHGEDVKVNNCTVEHFGSCTWLDSSSVAEISLPAARATCFAAGAGAFMAAQSPSKQAAMDVLIPGPINPADGMVSAYSSSLLPIADAYAATDFVNQLSSIPDWIWETHSDSNPKWHAWKVGSPVLIGGLGLEDQVAVWTDVAGSLQLEVADRHTRAVLPACDMPRFEKCPKGWNFLHALPDKPRDPSSALAFGSCFLKTGVSASYSEAIQMCQAQVQLGGEATVLVIESKAEQDILSTWLDPGESAWLGLLQSVPGVGVFASTSAAKASPITFNNISSSWRQWSSSLQIDGSQPCVQFDGALWQTSECTVPRSIICELVAAIPWMHARALTAFSGDISIGTQPGSDVIPMGASYASTSLLGQTPTADPCAYSASISTASLLHPTADLSILEVNNASMYSPELHLTLDSTPASLNTFVYSGAWDSVRMVLQLNQTSVVSSVHVLASATDSVRLLSLEGMNASNVPLALVAFDGACNLGGATASASHCKQWAGAGRWSAFDLLQPSMLSGVVLRLSGPVADLRKFSLSGLAVEVSDESCCNTVATSASTAFTVSITPGYPAGSLQLQSMLHTAHPTRFVHEEGAATAFQYTVLADSLLHLAGVAFRLESGSRFSGLTISAGGLSAVFECQAGNGAGVGAIDFSIECSQFNGDGQWSQFLLPEPAVAVSEVTLAFARAGQDTASGVSFDGISLLVAQRSCFSASPSASATTSATPTPSTSAT